MTTTPPIFSLADPLHDGMLCLEASAGTGKTYTIEGLVTRLVAEADIPIDALLVVTFTNAATSELKTRIRRTLIEARAALVRVQDGQAARSEDHAVAAVLLARCPDEAQRAVAITRLGRAVEAFDEAQISTIHGFCQRALHEHAFESGAPFDAELVQSTRPLVEELAHDGWTRLRHDADPYLLQHLDACAVTVKTLTDTATLVAEDPDAPACPPRPDPATIATRWTRWQQAIDGLRPRWVAERDAIVTFLDQAAGRKELNKPYSGPEANTAAREALDAWFAGDGAPYPGDTTALAHFAHETVQDAISKRKSIPPVVTHPFLHEVQGVLDVAWEAVGALNDLVLDFMHTFREEVRAGFVERKAAQRILAFGDLLRTMHRRVTGPEANPALVTALRRRYQVALIDEFQDTDPEQWGIFETIFGGDQGRLILVGDPKQAVYGFRGADIETYLAARRTPAMRVATLGINYRSDMAVVDGVTHLFTHAGVTDPFRNPDIHYPRVEAAHTSPRFWTGEATPPGLVFSFLRRSAVGTAADKAIGTFVLPQVETLVASQIVAFLGSDARMAEDDGTRRAVRPSDIAVLVRTNNQAQAIQRALRAVAVPSTVRSDKSVFSSAEANDLVVVLEAILDPARKGRVRQALATGLLGQDLHALAALEDDEEGWNEWVERLQAWRIAWVDKGFATLARALTTVVLPAPGAPSQTLPARLLGWRDGERRMTNLAHVLEILQDTALSRGLKPAALVAWMRRELDDLTKTQEDRRQLRLESDRDAVNIATIHKSKGLEYGFVWCPYLWSKAFVSGKGAPPFRFRDPNNGDRWSVHLGTTEDATQATHLALAMEAARQENLRMLYVALTRARHQVQVLCGAMGGLGESALGHLLFSGVVAPELMADEAFHDALAALAASSAGAMVVEDLPAMPPSTAYTRTAAASAEPTARPFDRDGPIDTWWRRTSFSGLTRDKHADEEPVQDRDAETEEADGAEGPDTPDLPDEPGRDDHRTLGLVGFKGGTRAGTCLHKVYEVHDFREAQALPALVHEQLDAHGFDADTWTTPITGAVQASLDAPLGITPALCLADLPRARRFDELDFVFPLRADDSGVLTPAALADLMAALPGPGMPHGYPERLRKLHFLPVRGFMVGSIDLIFEHGGRWYVVDYKSNNLGPHPSDYTPSRLAEAMSHHHYVLQYHIYCVALHRYLTWRLGDTYRFDSHFGGVLYLFMRGMSPDHAPGTGIFRDTPPQALVEGLSELMGGGA